ncbi:MAG: hypothetical protein ACLR7D_01975 [Lachnospira eligens]
MNWMHTGKKRLWQVYERCRLFPALLGLDDFRKACTGNGTANVHYLNRKYPRC